MGIFSRFADIVNANINALLDKAEDPEKLIRLIVQEMEDTLVEVRTASAKTIAEKKDVSRRIDLLKSEAEEWERKAELAISKGREDLAKAALVEKNHAQNAAEEMQHELDRLEDVLSKLTAEITQLQEKLNDAKARQKSLIMRHKTTSSRLRVKKTLHDSAAEDALGRFDRFERKLDELESEVESYDLGKNRSLADEIDDLEKEDEIDRQLAELKARVSSSNSKKTTKKDS